MSTFPGFEFFFLGMIGTDFRVVHLSAGDLVVDFRLIQTREKLVIPRCCGSSEYLHFNPRRGL